MKIGKLRGPKSEDFKDILRDKVKDQILKGKYAKISKKSDFSLVIRIKGADPDQAQSSAAIKSANKRLPRLIRITTSDPDHGLFRN